MSEADLRGARTQVDQHHPRAGASPAPTFRPRHRSSIDVGATLAVAWGGALLCDAFAIPGGQRPAANCCIVGNKEDREQDDAEDQVRDRSRNELARGARKIQLREPYVGVGSESDANDDAQGAENLRDSDSTWVAVAPKDVEQGEACEARKEANQAVADVPVQVNAIAGNQVTEEVAQAPGDKADNRTEDGAKEEWDNDSWTNRDITNAGELQEICEIAQAAIEGSAKRHVYDLAYTYSPDAWP